MRLLDAIIPTRSQRGPDGMGTMSLADAYFGAGNQLGGFTTFSVGGQTYTVPIMTSIPGQKTEGIANSFEGYALNGLMGNSVIFSLTAIRMRVFSEARFAYQHMSKGRPADLWSDKTLAILDHPWPGGVTGDLLAIMLLHADFAGNAYIANISGQLVPMRPDWVDIILAERKYTDSTGYTGVVGMEKVGYLYYQGGRQTGVSPVMFGKDDVTHFAPMPDPLANYRGMSWVTPVIREIRSDTSAMDHKLKFFENAATPNLAVSLPGVTDPDQFNAFVDAMDESHKGVQNAYKTLYLGAGADVTLIGSNFKDMEFTGLQGKGETRMASAAGVPPSVAGLSEGLQGSSLNAGNFAAARRLFGETTLSQLWRNVCGSLETIVTPNSGSRLWYDTRDIPFLRADQVDLANIQTAKSQSIRELFMAGFTQDSIVAAVMADDFTLLVSQPVYSIQVQTPGQMQPKMPSTVDEPPAALPGTDQQKPAALAPGDAPPSTGSKHRRPTAPKRRPKQQRTEQNHEHATRQRIPLLLRRHPRLRWEQGDRRKDRRPAHGSRLERR